MVMKTKQKVERLLHTISEARERLGGVSANTIYALFDLGELEPVKIGGRTMVRASDIEALAARGTHGGGLQKAAQEKKELQTAA
jgi:hypothetical protein